jgi:hypothetical protein
VTQDDGSEVTHGVADRVDAGPSGVDVLTGGTGDRTRTHARGPARTTGRGIARAATLVVAIFVFVLSIEMMKRGGLAVAPHVRGGVLANNAVSTLGTGQLLAYVFLSGKPVAAFALALFARGGLSELQAFTMLSGGRLGAAFIVLLVGFLYALRSRRAGESVGVGVVALVLTAVTYLPGIVVGYMLLKSGALSGVRVHIGDMEGVVQLIWGPIVDAIDVVLPTWMLLPLGGVAIVSAVKLLDRALPEVDGSRRGSAARERLRRPWAMFLLGFGMTVVTFSVSVALTALVPLTARGYVKREQLVPYIMGSNVATLADTLLVAVLIGNPVGVQIVLAEAVGVAAVTAVLLVGAYRPLAGSVLTFEAWILASGRRLWIFVAILLAVPLALLALGQMLPHPAA